MVPMLLASGAVGGCGHSEEEWQAQLDKYEQLAQQHSDLQAELDKERDRAKQLMQELEKMGVKLNTTGSEKDKMAKSLEDMRSALDEFKKRADALERIKARFELLQQKLKQLTDLGLDVKIRNNRMLISLPGDVLFAAGKDELSKKGRTVLGKVANVIGSDDSLRKRHYQVAGHTDNQKLKKTADMFKDNWGLSAMRAREVVVFLVTDEGKKDGGGGLPPKHWSAAGYGATDPIATNATKFGRQKNRRVELVILPDVEEMLDLQSLMKAEEKAEKK